MAEGGSVVKDTDYIERDIRERREAIGDIAEELSARVEKVKRTVRPTMSPVPWGRWLVIGGIATGSVATALLGWMLLRRS